MASPHGHAPIATGSRFMLLTLTKDIRVLFVGGKGGVGKTSTSSALALAHAEAGRRVLLVSTDPAHNLGHLWESTLGDHPTRIFDEHPGFIDAVEIDPQRTVDRHLGAVGDMMELLLPERMHRHAKQHLSLAREAPGSHEAAVLERIADLVTEGLEQYDHVIFDTAPTGHTLRLLQLPEQLSAWTETLLKNRDRSERFGSAMRGLTSAKDTDPARGPEAQLRETLLTRRQRFETLRTILDDEHMTGFLIVLTPERIPVLETIELATSLGETNMRVVAMIANRRSPAESPGLLGERYLAETEHLSTLRETFSQAAVIEVPLMPREPLGIQGLRELNAYY